MAEVTVRWSRAEAGKPYSRPFGVAFAGDDGAALGAVAVSGSDLLYYRQFQGAVLALTGELFREPAVEASAAPQVVWLDRLGAVMPAGGRFSASPASHFDAQDGRIFAIMVSIEGREATIEPRDLLEYQDFQGAIAHQTGILYRDPGVEEVEDPISARAAWVGMVNRMLGRPSESEAMAAAWPWR